MDEDTGKITYPTNARERLVTPFFDLSNVAGETASLTYWELYDMMDPVDADLLVEVSTPGDQRRVYIQALEPHPDGSDRPGEWHELDDYAFKTDQRSSCTDLDPSWCQVDLDLSRFIGQRVRAAFEVETTRLDPEPPDRTGSGIEGWQWLIDEVTVEAASMTGQPVQLRLRAGTDASISEGHWKVQNLQLVASLYGTNVAIVPDEPIPREVERGDGEKLILNGTIRNLGSAMQSNLFLDVNAVPVQEENGESNIPDLKVSFLRDGQGATTEPMEGPIGPFNLNAAASTTLAGNPTDRIPYAIEVEVPDDAPDGVSYQIMMRVVDASGNPLTDQDNMGDHERAFTLRVVNDPTQPDGRFGVHPPTLEELGETARFGLDLQNTAARSLTGTVDVKAVRLDTESDAVEIPIEVLDFSLPVGRDTNLAWDWTPSEPGFYRINATVDAEGIAVTEFYSHLLVGMVPIYFSEDFAQDPCAGEQWMLECDIGGWHRSTGMNPRHGNASLFAGNEGSVMYPEMQASAQTPWLDLSFLAKDHTADGAIREGDSPFSPYLSLTYKSILRPGDTVNVMAGHDGEDGDGMKNLITRDANSGRTGAEGLTGLDDQRWLTASFPLFQESNNVLGANDALLSDNNVSFLFQADWQGGDGTGFAIDQVTVSSYDVAVAPASKEITLRPGADKTFYFHVENTGAATDTYRIRLDLDETSRLMLDEFGVTLEIPQSMQTLTLEPGASVSVPVDVSIPYERLSSLGVSQFAIEVVSTMDPNRAATSMVHVAEFIPDDLPDLVMDLRRPGGETGPVGEGEQANFVVSVTNDGSAASRETDVVLFACPEKIKVNETLQTLTIEECREKKLAKGLGERRMPALEPSRDMADGQTDDVWTTTISWIPEVARDRGDYRIIAVADPLKQVPQFDRASSVDALGLTVAPFEQPNLNVIGLKVTDANGEPVESTFAGEVLNIEGTVVNDGDAPAPNVRVRILNQFALRDDRIGDLNPGGSQTLNAQWIARPGNWVIQFEASTGAVEASTANNLKSWTLAVRSGTVSAEWRPDTMHLDPEQSDQGILAVRNQRDEPLDTVITTTTDMTSVKGLPDALEIGRGASRELPFTLTVSPFAQPGTQKVEVELIERGTGTRLAASTLEVHVGADRGLRVLPEPLFTPPGTTQLPLVFKNDGNAPESFTVGLEAPQGWGATAVPPNLRLDPGSQGTVQAVLEIPPGTPAGRYAIDVAAGDALKHRANVEVLREAVWRTEVLAVHSHRDPMEVLLRVVNDGNAPAVPSFAMEGTDEPVFSIRPGPTAQEPGETRTYRVSVPAMQASSLVLPGKEAPVPLEAPAKKSAVEAVRLDLQSGGAVHAGDRVAFRFSVKNVEEQPKKDLLVSLWADGLLSADKRIDLEPGERRDVEFVWNVAAHGPRVVTATVASQEDTVARTMVLDVQPAESRFAIPGPGLLLLVLLLGAAAILASRRRRP